MNRFARLFVLPLGFSGFLVLGAGCSTNPATGRSQISLIGQDREIQMGREADQQVSEQLGLYDDPKVQAYVERIGRKIAADSERPELPWSFKVVDDPVVNAFALPGGFIYVTRGLLTHLNSEAELASVLGHEIGHVTARHSVEQQSKQQLAQIGLLAGMIARPDLANGLGQLAQQGLGLLFLKYSRDDERQADDLGLRYMFREGYDPREMPQVFAVLKRVSEQQGGGRIPGWLATHPGEDERIRRISAEVAKLGVDPAGSPSRTVGREAYLRATDHLTFGPDPRQGYFQGSRFVQPQLGFEIRFPEGWKTANQRQSVTAVAPGQDAAMALSLTGQGSAQAAAQQFFGQQGIQQGQSLASDLSGVSGVSSTFLASTDQGDLQGVVAFVEQGGKVYQVLGYTPQSRWGSYGDTLRRSLATFSRVTDRRALDVQPKRIEVVTLQDAMTLEEFARRYPSTVDLQTLAIINQVNAGDRLAAGTPVKRVVGGPALA
jgi:predicted Zn-dependent protease